MSTLDDLELSVRAGNVLRREGIETLEQFLALDKPAVMAMKGAGVRVWREISEVQRDIAPTEADIREEETARIRSMCEALNFFLDAHPDYAVRLVEGRVQPMRVLNDET